MAPPRENRERLAPRRRVRKSLGMQSLLALPLAAAQATPWEHLQRVPKQTWINVAICVLTVIVIVKVWKVLKGMNDFLPYIAAFVASVLICFYWIYERAEPKFLTPVVEKIAPFFPSGVSPQQLQERRRSGGGD